MANGNSQFHAGNLPSHGVPKTRTTSARNHQTYSQTRPQRSRVRPGRNDQPVYQEEKLREEDEQEVQVDIEHEDLEVMDKEQGKRNEQPKQKWVVKSRAGSIGAEDQNEVSHVQIQVINKEKASKLSKDMSALFHALRPLSHEFDRKMSLLARLQKVVQELWPGMFPTIVHEQNGFN